MKKMMLLMLALVLGLALAACGAGDKTSQSSGKKQVNTSGGNDSKSETVVNVGSSPTYPPFETTKNGKFYGFDVAMLKKLGEQEGLKFKIQSMPFDGLIPALQTGRVDMVIAGLSITDKRMKQVNFSNAYYKSGLSVLTKPDSGIKGFDDLKGKIVGTQKGSSSASYLRDHGIPDSKIKQYDSISSAYNALDSGSLDAVLYDNPSHIDYLNKHKTDAKIVGDLLTGEYYGIAVNKKKTELLKKINDGLAKIQKNGEYKQLFKQYLNGDMNGLVKDVKKPAVVMTKSE